MPALSLRLLSPHGWLSPAALLDSRSRRSSSAAFQWGVVRAGELLQQAARPTDLGLDISHLRR